MTPTTS